MLPKVLHTDNISFYRNLYQLRKAAPDVDKIYMINNAGTFTAWTFDPTDTTSSDNGTTVIVGTGTSRYKPLTVGGGGAVSSVFTRTGAVTAATNDYTWAQVDKTTSSLADLTTKSAAALSSGTLADARLSANVPLKNTANNFTGDQIVTGVVGATGAGGAFEIFRRDNSTNAGLLYSNSGELNLYSFTTSSSHLSLSTAGDATILGSVTAKSINATQNQDALSLNVLTNTSSGGSAAAGIQFAVTGNNYYVYATSPASANPSSLILQSPGVIRFFPNSTQALMFDGSSHAIFVNNVVSPQVVQTQQSLTDGATITWTVDTGTNATVTIAGNRTLAITGTATGASGRLIVVQGSGGSHTLTLPAGSKVAGGGGGAVSLSTGVGAIDILTYYYNGTNYFWKLDTNYT